MIDWLIERRNEQLLDDVIVQVLICLTTYTYQDLQ